MDDQFRSDEGMIKEQNPGDVICENNFECVSNLCIDSPCIESGLFQRKINWFRTILNNNISRIHNA
jgi:hypothetical protein